MYIHMYRGSCKVLEESLHKILVKYVETRWHRDALLSSVYSMDNKLLLLEIL
ncbi:hypothetical protein HanXRQr2_Chr04g0175891 [Helianthus annuus]|uniref:Uncharacterized protein n=1 Tax=Helianthus annuus TaxID=4232 RepID=A0A9K3NT46_HELAN|nr:hypothetical protein HanXRQr2_Chr04g0175891 [Helianthus annuus]KAJ0932097.1 hypothetical protein HanPSC8_Chr04g0169721 [Helianthus annuus]